MTFDLLTETVFVFFFLVFFYPDRLRSRFLNRLNGEN